MAIAALTLAVGGAISGDERSAALIVLAGLALAAPRRRRLPIAGILLCAVWGGVRTDLIDRGARSFPARSLHAAPIELRETLPAHGPLSPSTPSARGVLDGRSVVVQPARYGRPIPVLRRGWRIAADGRLLPLSGGAGDRRLARQGVAGRVLLTSARDTDARRGGVLGRIDAIARDGAAAMHAAGGARAGPLLAGMSLGTAEEVSASDRDALRAAGLWHLAAASGGNVALVIALAMVLTWLAGLPDRGRLLVAGIAVVAYVPLAGAGPSIQRAGVMGVAALLVLAAGREHRTADALALAAAATLAVDPRAWMDAGWQLSFAATAGLLVAVGPGQRRLTSAGVPQSIAIALATTLAATVATAPIMLATFGSVSLIGLVTNVAAAPLAAVAVWSGALAALAAPLAPPLAVVIAEPGAHAASAVLSVAGWAAGRPYAQLGADGALLALAGAAILALLRPAAPITFALAAGVLAWVALVPARPPSEPRLVVFDIGQGSAALLQDGDEAVLVDAGPVDGDVLGQLRRAGVRRLRAIVLSHPAADHDGGGAAVLAAIPTELLLDGGEPGGGPTHAAAIREARRRGVRVAPVRVGQRLQVGRLALRIRWPTPSAAHRPGDPNDRAAVVEASLGRLRVVVPADAEGNVLTQLPGLAADVLVVSHHGSEDPALPTLLRRLRPALAVISVGARNDYGHPRPATLDALRRAGVPTLRTDRGGGVDVRWGARGLVVRRVARGP